MYQSWVSRNLATEFQESDQVFKALLMILLVSFVGMPVIFISRDNPDANLFLGSAIVFVICVSILAQLFLPKLQYESKRKLSANAKSSAIASLAVRTTVVNNHQHCDSESFCDGEIILSTKTRRELILEVDNLREQLLVFKSKSGLLIPQSQNGSFRSMEDVDVSDLGMECTSRTNNTAPTASIKTNTTGPTTPSTSIKQI